jgi:2-keto-4-pentenoate hydratase/2-oxohepta-3-ene-1,7-dioic acid hydratase in catechol pathway
MRLVTFTSNERGTERAARVGALLPGGEFVVDLLAAIEAGRRGMGSDIPGDPLSWFDLDGPWLPAARALLDEIGRDVHRHGRGREWVLSRDAIHVLAPVPRPGKLICVGLNYRDHAAESAMPIPDQPVIFSKYATAVVGPDQPVLLPPASSKVDYEAELAVVIGRRAKHVRRERAFDYVLGYTNFNDVSARDFQFADGQWVRGKSCDTFAPMGPHVATSDEIPDPHRLSIKFRLNGRTMQDSNTDQLIFGIPELIAFLSESITLEPGDVIATGTPPGVGFARQPPVFLQPGDVMEVEVEGLGVLANPVTGLPSGATRS